MIMRSQGCTIQQALTPEAAAVVKQAVALAKRRGHAQVTPLHVAHTMLSSSSGLFRAACLQANSHPLHCRALELCFNVALQRLPTSNSGPMLGPTLLHQPTIANALVAAFKRAQAHQRRGAIENSQQQQPILAVKIELEQLIISILDDPSVSRVMREAGFSSPLVKAKVEQALSMELGSQNQAPNNNSSSSMNNSKPMVVGSTTKPRSPSNRNDDAMSVINSLMDRKKRNTVVVGESLETLEGLVGDVMKRVENGEVPEGLKGVKFIKLSLSSFAHLSRDEVDRRISELKCLIKSYDRGVVLYLDDLKSAIELRVNSNSSINILRDQHQPRWNCYYCPIEQVIMEIRNWVFEHDDRESKQLWLLGIATFQTYMRCRSGEPSLESIWDLHAVTVPAGSLGLSLVSDSELHLQSPLTSKKGEISGNSWLMLERGGAGDRHHHQLGGSTSMEGRSLSGCNSESTTSSLPPWLQQYKDEKSKRENNNDQDPVPAKDFKRWSTFCTSSTDISQSAQPSSSSFERSLSFSSISPSSTLNFSSYENHYSKSQHNLQSFESKNFWVRELPNSTNDQQNDMNPQQRQTMLPISPNPCSTPTSTSSREIRDQMESQCVLPRFSEYNAENLRKLCNALEQKAPSQKDIVFDIASTVLRCRSGMVARKGKHISKDNNEGGSSKEETWLFFQGGDVDSKEKMARELARLVFGSQDNFVSIGLSSFSSTRVDSSEDRNKRGRDEQNCSYVERFAEAVSNNPHKVFFLEDIEQVDYSSLMGIKKAIERGGIAKCSSGKEASFCDAIIILSCERFRSRSRACSPSTKQKGDVSSNNEDDVASSSISLDLNISINGCEENEDSDAVQGQSMDEIGLLASVDRCIFFRNSQD